MTHILTNKALEVHIDNPMENYNFSRFDWTGKITTLKFQNHLLSTIERPDDQNEHHFGKGFYNEFGMDTALGFEDAGPGGWFHKIGIGLLKKEGTKYLFHKNYKIKPAEFHVIPTSNSLTIHCTSQSLHGYAYVLKKEIQLHESGFSIQYDLQNTGEKDIITEEYNHNFTAINEDPIGAHYLLKFPFELKPELFDAVVNPESKVDLGHDQIQWNSVPGEPFFFSNLSGGKNVNAAWELAHLKSKIGISETGSFQTDKVNLWGWKHVISPELFFKIHITPGQSGKWSRNYTIFTTP
ncbi:hypothetical protein [Spongiimicrobium salis]|uniref:hypothetical protein n=1 Tax=Spongiimicrobium salis TaxID=1667022 RepID=UPI00374CC62D